jgi:microcystin-dependent protein
MDAAGDTGGSKTNTLVEANLPPHDHAINHDHPSFNLPSGVVQANTTAVTGSGPRVNDIGGVTGAGGTTLALPINIPNYTGTSGLGSGTSTPVNNLSPYLAVYMWRRTA